MAADAALAAYAPATVADPLTRSAAEVVAEPPVDDLAVADAGPVKRARRGVPKVVILGVGSRGWLHLLSGWICDVATRSSDCGKHLL